MKVQNMKSILIIVIATMRLSLMFGSSFTIIQNMTNQQKYSVRIDVFTKGTYRIYLLQMIDGKFKAVKYFANNKPPEIISEKELSVREANEFENYILSFPVDSLEDKYLNDMVRGEHHLIFNISIGEKQKEVYVYFSEQKDLKLLYQKMNAYVPENRRFWYY